MFIGEDTFVNELTVDTVDDYILWIRNNRACNNTSINTHLRSLRALLKYGSDNGMMQPVKVNMVKCEKQVKETYTDAEIETLLRKPDLKTCTFVTYRTWVLENYLLGTGNRISTALNVRICDLDYTGCTITLNKNKNRRGQIIPLSGTLSRILKEYLSYRGGCPEDYLFCSETGTKATVNSMKLAVRKYNRKHGVNKTSCHLFRHTFAKNWILAGGDVFRLQKILGHSDITVTREYLDMFGQDLQQDFEKYNPLDRLMITDNKIRIH